MSGHNRPSGVRQHKRHGKHQKHTKDFLKVYFPYVPLVLIILTGLVFTAAWQPRMNHLRGVLAYATSMSSQDLLTRTNAERAAAGRGSLSISAQLAQAAQAKANDMAARNYWSHNTPEGNPPWIFIEQAGYSYSKAGENLAYGFATSSDTVTGWMNSPSHKENLLGVDYTEVGFGYANASDYQGTGPETIVVAMYGTPLGASTVATAPAPAPAPTPVPQSKAATNPAPAPSPAPTPAPSEAAPSELTPSDNEESPIIVATADPSSKAPIAEPASQSVSRLATVTGGALPWLTSFATMTVIFSTGALLLKHGFAVRRWLVRGERYVLHHPIFDVTVASLVGLCIIVSQSAGFIK